MGDDNMTMGYLMGQESNNNRNNGGLFGGGDGWLGLIVLVALLGGGFGNGFGGFGGGGGVQPAFTMNNIESGIRGIQQGLCDGFYAVNTALLNGFNGVQGQLANCCCETQRNIDSIRFDMATGFCNLGNAINGQTRDIIENQNANYRSLMDFLVQEKLSAKDARIAELNNQVSQANQNAVIRAAIDASTAEIIRRTGNDCPVPAYVVPNPNCCYGNPLGVGYNGYGNGYNNGGCGCGI
jgi:hypothetical protein